jgi:hypothetical protein
MSLSRLTTIACTWWHQSYRSPYSVVFLIDLGYPLPAVSCGLCQKATAGILQAPRDWLLR